MEIIEEASLSSSPVALWPGINSDHLTQEPDPETVGTYPTDARWRLSSSPTA